MKKSLISILLGLLAATQMLAQEKPLSLCNNSEKLTLLQPVKTSSNIIRVIDSVIEFNYNSSTSTWLPMSKSTIISRHWGTEGWPNEVLDYYYINNSWKVYYYTKVDYYPNHTFHKFLNKAYNNFLGIFKDTIYYGELSTFTDQYGDTLYLADQEASYDFNTNALFAGQKMYFTFLSDSQYQERTLYLYNPATEKFDQKYEKITYEYNSQNLLAILSSYIWNSTTNTYENNYKSLFSYYPDGKPKTNVFQTFSSTWTNVNKEEYTYYPNGLLKTYTYYSVDGMNNFIPDYKDSIIYNNSDLMIKRYYFLWDNVLNTWKNNAKISYTYNPQELLTQQLNETWDGTNWVPYYRYSYTYNAQGKKTEILEEGYQTSTSTWIIYYKTTYQYDASGLNETERIYYQNDPPVAYAKYTTTYDTYNNRTMYMYSIWDNGTSSWIPDWKTVYYWSDWDANALPDHENYKLNIYPNPCQNEVLVSCDHLIRNIILYDITGKTLQSYNPDSKSYFISLNSYPRGTYVLDVMTSQGKMRKLIIKN